MIHVFIIAPGWELARRPCILSPFAPQRSITSISFSTLLHFKHTKNERTLIAVKNKPNFGWLKTLTYANKCIFLIKKQTVKLFLRRRHFFSGLFVYFCAFTFSGGEAPH